MMRIRVGRRIGHCPKLLEETYIVFFPEPFSEAALSQRSNCNAGPLNASARRLDRADPALIHAVMSAAHDLDGHDSIGFGYDRVDVNPKVGKRGPPACYQLDHTFLELLTSEILVHGMEVAASKDIFKVTADKRLSIDVGHDTILPEWWLSVKRWTA